MLTAPGARSTKRAVTVTAESASACDHVAAQPARIIKEAPSTNLLGARAAYLGEPPGACGRGASCRIAVQRCG